MEFHIFFPFHRTRAIKIYKLGTWVNNPVCVFSIQGTWKMQLPCFYRRKWETGLSCFLCCIAFWHKPSKCYYFETQANHECFFFFQSGHIWTRFPVFQFWLRRKWENGSAYFHPVLDTLHFDMSHQNEALQHCDISKSNWNIQMLLYLRSHGLFTRKWVNGCSYFHPFQLCYVSDMSCQNGMSVQNGTSTKYVASLRAYSINSSCSLFV